MFLPKKTSLYYDKMPFFYVFSYGFYTDLDDDELLGYFPLKLEEYNTSGDFAEMDIIFNRRVFFLSFFVINIVGSRETDTMPFFQAFPGCLGVIFFRPLITILPCLLVTFGQSVATWARAY